MSSDTQFTALGESFPPGTPFGFHTDATNIIYGVNVQGVVTDLTDPKHGTGCGVYASALTEPDLRASQANSRPGVWGVGDHYGIYGASNFLYDSTATPIVDHTPVLSPDINPPTPPPKTAVFGGIGVVGAAYKTAGVVGTSALTDAEASFSNIGTGAVGSIVGRSVGVIGISGSPQPFGFRGTAVGCAGVLGMSVREMTAGDLGAPLDLGVQAVLDDPGSAGGMGVFGWSFRGRGGVFGSASALPPAGEAAKGIEDRASAQVRLLPAPVTEARAVPQPLPALVLPKLPKNGQPGDIMATSVTDAQSGVPQTRLWFCVSPGLWAEVLLGGTIPGRY